MTTQPRKLVAVENTRVLFRNFKGEKGTFNAEGDRNFCAILTEEQYEELLNEGWNVKRTKPRDDEEFGEPYIKVIVKYGAYPPKIVLVSGRNRTVLDESSVEILDWSDITNVDLTFTPYNWTNARGETGISAYAKTVWVTIEEDPFAGKYDIPQAGRLVESEEFEDRR